MGIAAPSGLDDSAGPPADVAAGKVVVGVVTPLVKGTPSDPELALVNAGVADEAVVSGAADVLPGFKTLFHVLAKYAHMAALWEEAY